MTEAQKEATWLKRDMEYIAATKRHLRAAYENGALPMRDLAIVNRIKAAVEKQLYLLNQDHDRFSKRYQELVQGMSTEEYNELRINQVLS